MGYRVTIAGGIPTAHPRSMETVAIALLDVDKTGWVYVRDQQQPQFVAAFDMQRGVINVTEHGSTLPESKYPDWINTVRRIISYTHPTFKENSNAQGPTGHPVDG